MIFDVAPEGLLIPKALLGGADRLLLLRENGRIVLVPLVEQGPTGGAPGSDDGTQPGPATDDPIWGLGRNPVSTGVTDGSVNHDHYLSGDPHGEGS